ncbi:DUF3592 domain-containing protein [Streptomyces sp. NPDC020747]|uniref:DUF3592 domain-containing protein n=1 Tax=Streptomyces sp. NPDC020747 TaxID=3365086 RepID=UPI0037B0E5DC
MAKKQKKRHPTGEWQLPPHTEETRASSQRWAKIKEAKSRPLLPGRKTILGMLGVSALTIGMFLALLLPANSLVDDLNDRGVTASAVVTGVDNKPKYVKVKFKFSGNTTQTDLYDFAGMQPEVNVGENLMVVYDPRNPNRVLSQDWVDNPPFLSFPILGTALLALVCTAMAVTVILRRRWHLRTFGPPPLTDAKDPSAFEPKKRKGKAATDLTKP